MNFKVSSLALCFIIYIKVIYLHYYNLYAFKIVVINYN